MGMPVLYQNVKNNWVRVNYRRLEDIRKRCIEYSLRGTQGIDFPIETIIKTFDFMIVELERVEREKEELIKKNEEIEE